MKALQGTTKGSEAYNTDLKQLNSDEQTLRTDVFALRDNSSSYSQFSNAMESHHASLKETATDLDQKLGLKTEASETTAYYPLTNYEKYFKTGTNPPPPPPESPYPIAPPTGSTGFTNLDTASGQHVNTNAGEIGGDGGVVSTSANQVGANSVAFNEEAGKYGDVLWRSDNNSQAALNAKSVQLDATISLSADQLKNTAEVEKDIVVQKQDGTFGIVGTQINTKTGEVDFWNSQTHHWINEGSMGPLEANKDYNLQIGATINDTGNPSTGSYTYDYYSINGQKLDSKENTFGTVKMAHPWTPGIYVQTQADRTGSDGTLDAGFTESNSQLWLGY